MDKFTINIEDKEGNEFTFDAMKHSYKIDGYEKTKLFLGHPHTAKKCLILDLKGNIVKEFDGIESLYISRESEAQNA